MDQRSVRQISSPGVVESDVHLVGRKVFCILHKLYFTTTGRFEGPRIRGEQNSLLGVFSHEETICIV